MGSAIIEDVRGGQGMKLPGQIPQDESSADDAETQHVRRVAKILRQNTSRTFAGLELPANERKSCL